MKSFKRWSELRINTKFTLFILLVTISFLAAIFLISRDMLQTFSLQMAEELTGVILESTDARVRGFFEQMEALALSLAGTRTVLRIDPSGMRDLFISSVLPHRRYLRSIYLGTEDGRMFEWGVGPEFVDYTPTFPPGYDPRKRPWYQTALEKGAFSVSEPYRFASVDADGITCVLPVKDPAGHLIGVLGMDILLDNLKTFLDDLTIPKGGRALLISSKGQPIVGNVDPGSLVGIESQFHWEEGVFKMNIQGTEMLVSYRLSRPLGWHLIVSLPYDQILFNARWLLTLITFIELLLMGMLTIVISVITNRLITSPLHKIIAVINKIESGDRTCRVVVNSQDEFGILGKELNKLVGAVEEYSSSLEKKVQERTAEVQVLQQEITRLRVLEERKRIYRNMHDSIGAKLTNIFFCTNVARKMVEREQPADSGKLKELFDDIETNCLEAVKHVKNIIGGLEEETVGDFGTALLASVRKRLETNGIGFSCDLQGLDTLSSLSSHMQDELEKVFEELVSNVLKHAEATRVELEVQEQDGTLKIQFVDNGKGFDFQHEVLSGKGLENIRSRIEEQGGVFRMNTALKSGTCFFFELPLGSLLAAEEREEGG
ncbi:MAG: HAMP domain-containing protein [Spirochaetales bacterium]|nr:HAMP domain-containing protein [Spirochaetales bacterium]